MDHITLQCFVAVANGRSFTRAAKQLHRTQSAVSQQIAKLEKIVGRPLFQRTPTLMLTEAGELLLGYARKILFLQEEVMEHFRGLDVHGEIRFGLPEDFAAVKLSEVLIDFARSHPKVSLHVETDLTLNLLDRFKSGEFDLVLVKVAQPDDFPYGVSVWSEKLQWVGHQRLLESWNPSHPLPLVASPSPCIYRSGAIQTLEQAGMKWNLVFSSPSYAGTIAACTAQLGFTVLPESMIPEPLQGFSSPSLPPLRDVHVSLLKRANDNPAVDSLEEFVFHQGRAICAPTGGRKSREDVVVATDSKCWQHSA